MEQELKGIRITLMLIFIALCGICGAISAKADDCAKEVQVIKQGEVAGCDGFLFSDTAEKNAAEARDDVKFYNELVPRLEQKIDKEGERNQILEKRSDLYIKQSEVLAKDKVKSDNRKFWERLGMFALGLITMYGAVEVVESN